MAGWSHNPTNHQDILERQYPSGVTHRQSLAQRTKHLSITCIVVQLINVTQVNEPNISLQPTLDIAFSSVLRFTSARPERWHGQATAHQQMRRRPAASPRSSALRITSSSLGDPCCTLRVHDPRLTGAGITPARQSAPSSPLPTNSPYCYCHFGNTARTTDLASR